MIQDVITLRQTGLALVPSVDDPAAHGQRVCGGMPTAHTVTTVAGGAAARSQKKWGRDAVAQIGEAAEKENRHAEEWGQVYRKFKPAGANEDSVMAEFHRYPLRVQQSTLDGWWFVFVDEVPGLGVFGPNFQDLLDRLTVVAGNLLRARGEIVSDIEIISSEKLELHVFH